MNLCDEETIRTLLRRHAFHFSKSMGQNFLIEDWVPPAIVDASGAGAGTGVLEIGPGIGVLTRELCARAERVVSVELDRSLLPVLTETMAEAKNFVAVSGDILKTDIPALVRRELDGLRPIVCANLPYNITTPALTALVDARCFDSLTVLVQKEVAERICAAPGTAAYGAFSVYMQYYTAPRLCFSVPNTCFVPRPKVTSAVLHCPVRTAPPAAVEDEAFFHRTVRAAFAQRRKTLVNSLQSGFGTLSRTALAEAITAAGLDPGVRGEMLDLGQFAALSSRLWALCAEGGHHAVSK